MLCPRCSLPMHQYAMACARCGEATPRAVAKVFHSAPGAAGPRSNAPVPGEVRIDRRADGVRVLDLPWNPAGGKARAATPHWERSTHVRTPHLYPNAIPTAPEAPAPSAVFQATTDPAWIQEPDEKRTASRAPAEAPVLLASRWQRLVAWMIDAGVIGLVSGLAVLAALTVFGWRAVLPQLSGGFDEVLDGLIVGRSLWVFGVALFWMLAFVYAAVSHSLTGATLGQHLLGLRLETRDGEQPSFSDCAWRAGIGWMTMAFGGLSAAWALFDAQGLALHDRLVGTRMIRLPAPEREDTPDPAAE